MPISHISPNSHFSHNLTASSSGSRKSVRLAERVDSFDSVPSSFVQSVEPPNIISTSSNKKKPKMTFKWSNNFKYPVFIPFNVFKNKTDNVLAPIEYLSLFFKPEIFNIIVENTKLYGNQKSIRTDVN
jgi:hypothetical protein